MNKRAKVSFLLIFSKITISSIYGQGLIFSSVPESFKIDPGKIDEVSGITNSSTFPNHIWAHEDSKRPATLTLLTNQGRIEAVVQLPFPNRDWEDISRGSGPLSGASYIYLADIGDNNIRYDSKYIYRFLEPKSANETISKYERIEFVLEGENRDCEALLVDPITKNIYIISKWEKSVRLYELKIPLQENANVAKRAIDLPITKVTSATISPDGTEILIRTYDSVYYINRRNNESIPSALQNARYVKLQIEREIQGEAICFDTYNRGFFTVSEKSSSEFVNLNYYKRSSE